MMCFMGMIICDLRAILSHMPKVEVLLWHRSEISFPSLNISPNWYKGKKVKQPLSQQCLKACSVWLADPRSVVWQGTLPWIPTAMCLPMAPSCGCMLRVHPVFVSCVCPPECAWCKPAGHVVYLTQNRTPLMFQRMEPPSEGGGTDGQGGQGLNSLPSTQPDNPNSMWVDWAEAGTYILCNAPKHMRQQETMLAHKYIFPIVIYACIM